MELLFHNVSIKVFIAFQAFDWPTLGNTFLWPSFVSNLAMSRSWQRKLHHYSQEPVMQLYMLNLKLLFSLNKAITNSEIDWIGNISWRLLLPIRHSSTAFSSSGSSLYLYCVARATRCKSSCFQTSLRYAGIPGSRRFRTGGSCRKSPTIMSWKCMHWWI